MTWKPFRRRIKPFRLRIKSNPGRVPILHESRNKEQSIANSAEKIPMTLVGIEPGPPGSINQFSTTEPKSLLPNAVVRELI